MTSIFSAEGKNVPCTVIEAGPCIVTQIKTIESDGYQAVQIAFGDKKEKNATKAEVGHFKKAGSAPKRKVVEFLIKNDTQYSLGDALTVDLLKEDSLVNVVGTSKGKGFQGVMRRHGFSGVGGATHGQHNRLRAPGSLGASSFPARVFKGMRMAGQTGGERVKVANLKVLKVLPENNLILVKGAVPGANGSFLILEF